MSVSRTVYEIFSVEEWRDLETEVEVVQGHAILPQVNVRTWSFTFAREVLKNKLSCRRETARRFVSLNILQSHSIRSLKIIRNDTVE